mmetsp:Transcript_152349/g.265552  ORF Transcript_152349/g.265552 Transcript_152349/m.265552 type:complete len:402 (-) Transcript_152349:113-1318(-)
MFLHCGPRHIFLAVAALAANSVVQALDIASVADAEKDASATPASGKPVMPAKLQPVVEHVEKPKAKRALRKSAKQPSMVQSNSSATVKTAGIKPASAEDSKTGYFLTPMELGRINTIDCLQMKQKNPFVNCSTDIGYDSNYEVSPANYPSWKDPACRSNGEFFCDPNRLLDDEQRAKLTTLLGQLRKKSSVLCADRDPIDRWHYQPFYLGVALAKDWPLSLSDTETLQFFGRMLAARWNMSFPWDGSPLPYSRCPNEGMLIILPEQKQVFLSTPNCEFLCATRGGPEVVTAVNYVLKSQDLGKAVKSGIETIYKILNGTTPETANLVPSPQLDNWWQEGANIRVAPPAPSAARNWNAVVLTLGMRVLYLISLFVMAASLVVAILVCLLAPGLIKKITKSNV